MKEAILAAFIYGGGQGADVAMTCRAEARGALEANPLIGQGCSARLIGLKTGIAAGLTAIDAKAVRSGHRGYAWGLRIFVTAGEAVVIAKSARHR